MSLHVEVIGAGPDIVLLHGWAMHGGVFAPLVASAALWLTRSAHAISRSTSSCVAGAFPADPVAGAKVGTGVP